MSDFDVYAIWAFLTYKTNVTRIVRLGIWKPRRSGIEAEGRRIKAEAQSSTKGCSR